MSKKESNLTSIQVSDGGEDEKLCCLNNLGFCRYPEERKPKRWTDGSGFSRSGVDQKISGYFGWIWSNSIERNLDATNENYHRADTFCQVCTDWVQCHTAHTDDQQGHVQIKHQPFKQSIVRVAASSPVAENERDPIGDIAESNPFYKLVAGNGPRNSEMQLVILLPRMKQIPLGRTSNRIPTTVWQQGMGREALKCSLTKIYLQWQRKKFCRCTQPHLYKWRLGTSSGTAETCVFLMKYCPSASARLDERDDADHVLVNIWIWTMMWIIQSISAYRQFGGRWRADEKRWFYFFWWITIW